MLNRTVFNKSTKVFPCISLNWRLKTTFLRKLLRPFIIMPPLPDSQGRSVDVAPFPESFGKMERVRFLNNGRPEYDRIKDEDIRADMVVFCTGYQQEFPFLDSASSYPTAADADVRGVWFSSDPSVDFVGFMRPSFGAIPPLAELQAQLWVLQLVAPRRIPRPLLPPDEHHYRLLHPKGSRISYGVDHESYAYQLALDMDTAPGFLEVLRLGWHRRQPWCWWRLPAMWHSAPI
jgi:dimethylaniline monooxygenase (N-oxide forming)